MRLIRTIEEVNEHLNVQMTSYIDTVKPFISNAERIHLINSIGRSQFEVLVEAYKNANFQVKNIEDEELQSAVFLAQKTISCLGYYYAIPILSVKIGSSGIQILSNEDTKQAFNWQVDDLKKSLCELGFNALEELLSVLDESPDKFVDYATSSQKRDSEKYLIYNAKQFDSYFKIGGSRYIFNSIGYIMLRIESQRVAPIFGRAFFDGLKAGNLEGKSKQLVEEYVMPGIALLTAAKAIVERIITFQNGTAAINLSGNYNSAVNTIQATKNDIETTTAQLTADGGQFLEDGLQFILSNPTDFPDYEKPTPKKKYGVVSRREAGLFIP